jgi:AcrR family transcriptional regulator
MVTPPFRLVKSFFMSTSSRDRVLGGALELLRSGGTISLESAARHVGLSKPGVMYHFRTKEALMLALVDRVMDGWEEQMARRLPAPAEQVPARERLRAYLDWCLSGEFDETDLVMLTDPRLRGTLKERWAARVAPWVALPGDLPAEDRDRLLTVRLIADGAWFADASGILPLDPDERVRVRAVADALLAA